MIAIKSTSLMYSGHNMCICMFIVVFLHHTSLSAHQLSVQCAKLSSAEISKGVSLSAAEKDPKNATLKAYLAQHSFLLFTHICLSTASVLNQADSG